LRPPDWVLVPGVIGEPIYPESLIVVNFSDLEDDIFLFEF